MSKPRRILWLGAIVGIAYLVWRWRQQQIAEVAHPAPLPAAPPPRPAPSAAPVDQSGAPAAGPRRIITRVHRGAPPSASAQPAAGNGTAPPELAPTPDEPAAPTAETPLGDAPAEPLTALAPTLGEAAGSAAEPTLVAEAPAPPADADPAPAEEAPAPVAAVAESSDPINLNTADAEALIALPGIGPALASRIISHREEHGPFTSLDQLIDVQGIGPNNINDFRHLLYV